MQAVPPLMERWGSTQQSFPNLKSHLSLRLLIKRVALSIIDTPLLAFLNPSPCLRPWMCGYPCSRDAGQSELPGGHLEISDCIPPSAVQQGHRKDRASCQQVKIHYLVYLKVIQCTAEMQTDIYSGSGCSIKLLFCSSLYRTSYFFAVFMTLFCVWVKTKKKIFIVWGP